MPAAALSTGTPSSLTNANEKIITHATAKKSVVYAISRLLASIARSLRSTSSATFRNPGATSVPYHRAISRAKPRGSDLIGHELACADDCDTRVETIGEIVIVRGEHDEIGRASCRE